MTAPERHRSVKPAGIMIVVGSAFIAGYKVLAHYQIGKIGAPSDIGGGLIPLTGLILIPIGIVDGAVVLVARWWQRGRSGGR